MPPFTDSVRLVDLFCTPDLVPNLTAIKRHLLTYYSLLQSTHLTNAALSSLPLPETLDPNRPIPLPSRLFTLSLLIRDTLVALVFAGRDNTQNAFAWSLHALLGAPEWVARMRVEARENRKGGREVAYGDLSVRRRLSSPSLSLLLTYEPPN